MKIRIYDVLELNECRFMSFRLLLIYRDCWFGLRLWSNVLVFAVGLWHQAFALLCTVYIVCRGQAPLCPPDEPCSGAGEISTLWTPVMDSQKTVYVLGFGVCVLVRALRV